MGTGAVAGLAARGLTARGLTARGLTDQQHRAVAARNVSVALSAGAGCGKTFVLTERFLRQLQPPADGPAGRPRLGQLVAITFTERAAREMRERIRAACQKRLLEAPESQANYWLELIRELDSARISTIHSFCGGLLRAHAVEARLDPQFRVLDQAQADTLLYELLDRQLRNRLAEQDEAVIELAVQFSPQRLHEMVRTLLDRRQEIDWSQWGDETTDALLARWQDYWRSDTLPRALRRVAESSAARRVLDVARQHTPTHAKMRQRCDLLLERLPDLLEATEAASELAAIREAAKVQGGGGKKAWDDEEAYREFADAAGALRKQIDAVAGNSKKPGYVTFDAAAARPAAEMALRLLGVAADVCGAYETEKRELGVLDFNDLMIHARELLTGPGREELRRRIAAQIRLLLVDEFQDTDPLQVELVEALCGDELTRGKLFFVGDSKQSIYRFRGADPQVFRRLREAIPADGRLPLSLNFRSQPAILGFVNALFCEELGPDYEPLLPHRPQVSPTPAVEMLWATLDDPGPRTGQGDRLRGREADWIARRIRVMLDTPEVLVWDDEAAGAGTPVARAVRPGDVALLFRALSNVEIYEEALRRYGIDYYLVGGHAFYAQQEIYDLVNLLRALNSPCDEVSLAGALRSPFFSLEDETLYWLAQHGEGLLGGLAAGRWPAEIVAAQRRRVEFAAATMAELRAMKDRVPIAQLICEVLRRTGCDAIVLAEFLGERKLANLHKLIDQARSFDRSGIFTLADFITQLSQFVARQPDEALAATHGESTDVVRLMTIHQSKGLEFPVVVVPDVDRPRRVATGVAAFTGRLGPMVRYPDATSGFDLHMLAESDEERAELSRLLYVATTRAADYLILAAGLPRLDAVGGPWMELIHQRFDRLTGQLRGGGMEESASGDVAVRVTVSEPALQSTPTGPSRRPNLEELVEAARQTADSGGGRVPPFLAPVPPDLAARRQYSFSRLTGMLLPSEEGDELPSHQTLGEGWDMAGETFEPVTGPSPHAARELGTLVHEVLAEIEFADLGDVSDHDASGVDVSELVRRHAERKLPLSADELKEPIDMVRRFLASPRAGRIAAAKQVYAELEFLLAWPPDGQRPAQKYLQGFIDCIYRDADGQWHLLDYKTNRVTPATIDAVAAKYEMQMLVYALAVEQILGRRPVELTLSFLRPGLEYQFTFNDSTRRRVVEMVNQALHKAATGGYGLKHDARTG